MEAREFLVVLSFLPISVLSVFVLFSIRRSRESQRRLVHREQELSRKMYELAILKEVGERIGYSLDVEKIIDIITGSLRKLFPYSTSSSMLISEDNKVIFKCDLEESVSSEFVNGVKGKMLAALSALTGNDFTSSKAKIEEVVTGTIIDEENESPNTSFFNIPLVINEKVVGIINITSTKGGLYKEEEMTILYRITKQASDAVSKLQLVLETEKGKVISMVSSMADGVIMTDKDTHLAVINPAAKSMLNIQKDVVTIFDVIDSLTGKFDLRTRIEESIKLEKLLIHDELFIADKVLQVLVSPVKDRESKTLGSVVIFHNITNEKQLERLRQDFTAMMVHELRAPLTAMKGTSDTILLHLSQLTSDRLESSVKLLYDSSSQMLKLVNDLLDVAKIEVGKFEVIEEPSDLRGVIDEAVETFKSLADAKSLTITGQVDESVPQFLYFDRLRISQVLNNLLSNALKFTSVGGITLEAKATESEVIVCISDTGEGIRKEDIPSLFNKFKQLQSKERGVGTGLGLVISKGIIESHGGKIWVEAASGKGSSFYFSLPVGPSSVQVKTSAPDSNGRFTRKGKTL